MEDFKMSCESLARRVQWAHAVEEVEKAVRFRLDAMESKFAGSDEEDRERLAQAWARILQG
tara:strand:+ start:810 stop:992 length:183 start_codon:yes stop_codon:yes gene_type:complete